jgi:hypothetical protein
MRYRESGEIAAGLPTATRHEYCSRNPEPPPGTTSNGHYTAMQIDP